MPRLAVNVHPSPLVHMLLNEVHSSLQIFHGGLIVINLKVIYCMSYGESFLQVPPLEDVTG